VEIPRCSTRKLRSASGTSRHSRRCNISGRYWGKADMANGFSDLKKLKICEGCFGRLVQLRATRVKGSTERLTACARWRLANVCFTPKATDFWSTRQKPRDDRRKKR
jgi:hypothetical protein